MNKRVEEGVYRIAVEKLQSLETRMNKLRRERNMHRAIVQYLDKGFTAIEFQKLIEAYSEMCRDAFPSKGICDFDTWVSMNKDNVLKD